VKNPVEYFKGPDRDPYIQPRDEVRIDVVNGKPTLVWTNRFGGKPVRHPRLYHFMNYRIRRKEVLPVWILVVASFVGGVWAIDHNLKQQLKESCKVSAAGREENKDTLVAIARDFLHTPQARLDELTIFLDQRLPPRNCKEELR